MDFDISRRLLVPSLFILTGILVGFLMLTFPLPKALALTIGMSFLVLSIIKIEFPFYVFVFLLVMLVEEIPTSGSIFEHVTDRNYPGIPSLLEIALAVLVLSFIINWFLQRDKISLSPLNVPTIIFLGLFGLSIFIGLQNGVDGLLLKKEFKRFLAPVLFFICCANILNSDKKIHFLMILIFVIALIKSCLGIIYYLRGLGFLYESRINIVFLDTSDLLIFSTVIVVSVSLIIYREISGGKMLLVLLSISPMLFSLVFSYRRHAWLGFLLSLVILFLLVPWGRKSKMLTLGACGSLVILILISTSNLKGSLPSENFLQKRFLSIFDKKESTRVFRTSEWEVALVDTMKHPILGLGLGSTHRPTPGHDEIDTYIVHNAFLMLWMKMGLFALFLFLWCLIRYIIFGIHAATAKKEYGLKPLQIGLFASFGFWVVSLYVGPSWHYYRETCLMALAVSAVLAISRVRKHDSDEFEWQSAVSNRD